MEKSQPPTYIEAQPGFTPAQTYQPHNPPPQQATVIITSHPNMVAVGNEPSRVTCPSCHADILTSVTHQPTTKTHLWALILCLFGCWPCVCVPYCMDSCQSANHTCPNCNSYIGTFNN